MIFFYKILHVSDKYRRKESELEPEPQFVISASTQAPAPGNNIFSAPWLSAPAPQHCSEKRLTYWTGVQSGVQAFVLGILQQI
jgi:hypothetical protein